MSTSDTVLFLANGLAGEVKNKESFYSFLESMCIEMTKILARDGEGATTLLEIEINNAFSEEEANIFAKSLVNSPLIKTMVYGGDPNIGRIFMALGKCIENKLDKKQIRDIY